MIAAWMMYATVVAGLLSLAALALERAAAVLGGARRWPWAGATAASVALPALAILGFGPAAGSARLLPGRAEGALRAVLEPLVIAGSAADGAAGQGLEGIELALLAAWLLGSGVLALLYLRSGRTLARGRSDGEPVTVEGLGLDGVDGVDGVALHRIPVLLTDELGPAAVGYRRGEVLLPRWCLELSPEERALVLAHELEHLKSGDVRLLLAARCALVCLPWLLPLWWQVHRLRLAVEIDCDSRVLRRDVRPARYGELLLEVGRRRGGRRIAHAVAALAEPASNLERRIRAMTESKPRRRWLHATITAAGAVALVAVACESPTPADDASTTAAVQTEDEPTVPARSEAPDATAGAFPTEPSYVPRDVEPRLTNGREIQQVLQQQYPSMLREAGIGGTVVLFVFVDAGGEPTETQVQRSSGYPQLDAAAADVVDEMEFSPAMNRDEAVGVWVLQSVEFRASE